MKPILPLLFFFVLPNLSTAQTDIIPFKNPSFEGSAHYSFLPKGWVDCGFEGFSPPDTHPNDLYYVQQKAVEGATYIGMVTRDNDTWERVGQRLDQPILAGECYGLAIALARSPIYVSSSYMTQLEANYDVGVNLKIWGANQPCDGLEPLAETGVINNTNWKEHLLILKPSKEYHFLILEAIYRDSFEVAYNGNILLDNLSPLVRIPCEELEAVESSKWYRLFRKQLKTHRHFRKTLTTAPSNPNEIEVNLTNDLLTRTTRNWMDLILFLQMEEPDKNLILKIQEKTIKKGNRKKQRILKSLERANIPLDNLKVKVVSP